MQPSSAATGSPSPAPTGPTPTESNQAMLTAAIDGLVARFSPAGRARRRGRRRRRAQARARLQPHARVPCSAPQLASTSPAYDIQQACDTGLEAAVLVANKIALGQIDVGIAGGTDTASDAPVGLNEDLRKVLMEARRAQERRPAREADRQAAPGPDRARHPAQRRAAHRPVAWASTPRSRPRSGASTREDQDELAAASHQRLAAAYERGFFDDLVTPYARPRARPEPAPGLQRREAREAQARVRRGRGRDDDRRQLDPAHRRRRGRAAGQRRVGGRSTACPVLAHLTHVQTAAVDYVHGGDGPADGARARRPEAAREGRADAAGLRLLRDPRGVRLAGAGHARRPGRRTGLGTIDRAKLNVNGSSLAAGHPFAATGGRIVATLAKLLDEKGSGRGADLDLRRRRPGRRGGRWSEVSFDLSLTPAQHDLIERTHALRRGGGAPGRARATTASRSSRGRCSRPPRRRASTTRSSTAT